jgi:hypothetical protein
MLALFAIVGLVGLRFITCASAQVSKNIVIVSNDHACSEVILMRPDTEAKFISTKFFIPADDDAPKELPTSHQEDYYQHNYEKPQRARPNKPTSPA